MPELLTPIGGAESTLTKEKAEEVAHGLPSAPTGAIDNPPEEQPEPRFILDFLHFAKKLDDLNDRIAKLIDIEEQLLADRLKGRLFLDRWVNIGPQVEYEIDYLERKLLYIYNMTPAAITLALSNGGSFSAASYAWTACNYPRGTKITYPLGNAESTFIIRACDTPQKA